MDYADRLFTEKSDKLLDSHIGKLTESILKITLGMVAECPTVKKYMDDKKEKGGMITIFGNTISFSLLGAIAAMDYSDSIDISLSVAIGSGILAGMAGYYDKSINVRKIMETRKKIMGEYITKLYFGLNISDKNHNLYLSPDTRKVKNIDSLLHLRYWCFFALIAYQPSIVIEGILKTRRTDYAGIFDAKSTLQKIVIGENELLHFNNISPNSLNPEFFIFVDHLSSSIIISIKGISNGPKDAASDIITELSNATMVHLTLSGEHPGSLLVHSGFYKAGHNVLLKAKPYIYKLVEKYPYYDIKVVGHSYGAGVASVVAWGLEDDKINKIFVTNQSVRGILFCCPPIFNLYAADVSCYFLVSIVMGWDCISSISMSNLFKFACLHVKTDEKEEEFIFNNCTTGTSDSYLNSLYCQTYIPGTIYWMTYDEVTQEVEGLNIIYRSNDRLQHLIIHENMMKDNYIEKLYAYFLALIVKEERELERNEKLKERIRRKKEMDKIDLDLRVGTFEKLINRKNKFNEERDPLERIKIEKEMEEAEKEMEEESYIIISD